MRAFFLFLLTLVAGASIAAVSFADVAGDEPVPADASAPPGLDAGVDSAPTAISPPPLVTPPPFEMDSGAPPQGSAAPTDTDDGGLPGISGFSIALSVAGGVPIGLAKEGALSDVVAYDVPITIHAGYFLDDHLYFGGYFGYAFAFNAGGSSSTCPNDPNVSCTANIFRFGVEGEYHFRPEKRWDWWSGANLGYEILNVTATDSTDSTGASDLASSLNGFELGARGGVDYKPKKFYGFGPFVDLGVGHYWYSAFTVHGWASFGIRLRTGL